MPTANYVIMEFWGIIEWKGLNHAQYFPQMFKTKWIQIILRCIHDNYNWLEGGPIKITKRIINWVSSYPTIDRTKSMWSDTKETIKNNIGVLWNKRGMCIDTISDPLVAFVVRLISHTFF